MPRVKEIEDDGGDPILREVFAKEREIFGGLLNVTKVYAHCPPILKAAKQLSASIERSGQLPAGAPAPRLSAGRPHQRVSVLN